MGRNDEIGVKVASKHARGRPPAFDRQAAVKQAMLLFWERGYEGASFSALTEAMRLSASSLQNAFGSKEGLFVEAMRYYDETVSAWFSDTLAAPATGLEAFQKLFSEAATAFTKPDVPAGCMVSIAVMQVAPDLDSVRALARQARLRSQTALADRIRRGIAEGDVPAQTDADGLAAYFGAVFRGMAVQARDGASRNELLAIGAYAMKAWPEA